MISFIIYEKDIFFVEKYKIIIDKVMINYNIDYKIVMYKRELPKIINDTFKIYIMSSIENNTLTEIKRIRKEKDDWQSMIIITAESEEKRQVYLNSGLLLVNYINKHNDYDRKMKEAILICIKNYDQRPNTLKFTYKKNEYNIEYQNIILIEKEPNCKRCIVKTKENKYYLTGFLKDIEQQLDNRFIKCSKSHIINIEQVKQYNKKDNLIEFNNGLNFYEISRNCKKQLIERLKKVENCRIK